jgi:quinol monooxygenase YgiN
MIHVIATIHTAPGRRSDFLDIFHELVPQVRAETGCLEYGPTIDVDTPLSGQLVRPDVVTVVEQWASTAALKDHLAAPHMNSFREKVKSIVTGLEIRVLEPA